MSPDELAERISRAKVRVAKLTQQLHEAKDELHSLERRGEPPYSGMEFADDNRRIEIVRYHTPREAQLKDER